MKTTKNKKFQTPHEAKLSAAKASAQPAKADAKAPAPKQPAKTKPASKPRKGKLGELLGFSVVSVIRAFGKAGWDYETAKAALEKAKVEAAVHTIRVGLKRGRDGQKKIAPLSKTELEGLRATPAKANAKKKG